MILKIWFYDASTKGLVGKRALQARVASVALACGRYVVGLELREDDVATLKSAMNVGEYVTGSELGSDRIISRQADNLPPGQLADQVAIFSTYAASAGIERLAHIVWSYEREEVLDPLMRREHRAIIRRILGIERCPSLGADHGDTDNEHHHEVVVTVDAVSGDRVPFGQGWWKEAGQIAAAVIDYRYGLRSEPNRRYVADDTGVYHTFSDIKVAEADGTIVKDAAGKPDRAVVAAIQKSADALKGNNIQPEGEEWRARKWSLKRAAEILAQPRIEKAESWEEVHRSLARVGLRYRKEGRVAYLEAAGYASDWADRVVAASAAYPRAALGKLTDRLKADYTPPPPDLEVRNFVMPRYEEAKASSPEAAERRELAREAKEVEDFLKRDNNRAQQEIYRAKLKAQTNAEIARQAAASRTERELARSAAESSGAKRKRKRKSAEANPEPEIPFGMLLWGGPDQVHLRCWNEEEDEDLTRRYRRNRIPGGWEYSSEGQVAFIETRNLVVVRSRSRQAKIDSLKLAQAKFGAVRIMANKTETADMVALAVELGIELDKSHAAQADAHRAKIAADPGKGLLARDKARRLQRERTLQAEQRLRDLEPRIAEDQMARAYRSDELNDGSVGTWRIRNDTQRRLATEGHKIPLPEVEARDILDRRVPVHDLHLPSSTCSVGEVAYLDDKTLLKTFGARRHLLALPEVQQRLNAISLIQQRQREWLCAAIATGRVTIMPNGNPKIDRPEDQWARKVLVGQSTDPQFQRMVWQGRSDPEKFKNFGFTRPEIAAWKDAGGLAERPRPIAQAIVDELYLRTSANERSELIKQLPIKVARGLEKALERGRSTGGNVQEAADRSQPDSAAAADRRTGATRGSQHSSALDRD